MHEINPSLVAGAAEGETWGIDYGKMTPRLTGAIQALLARIEKLEATIEAN